MKPVTTRIPEADEEWLAELEEEMSADRATAVERETPPRGYSAKT